MPGSKYDEGAIAAVPHKYEDEVRMWRNNRTPEDGEPDEVIRLVHWEEADGTEVTDPARIAELEAKLAAHLVAQEGNV